MRGNIGAEVEISRYTPVDDWTDLSGNIPTKIKFDTIFVGKAKPGWKNTIVLKKMPVPLSMKEQLDLLMGGMYTSSCI